MTLGKPPAQPPTRLAFHAGAPDGSAHRIAWDGVALRYQRFRDGMERVAGRDVVPDEAAWAAFARAIAAIDPWAWEARYGDPVGEGERWSFELAWDGRAAMASGTGEHPAAFARLKRALWALLGDPPGI